MSRNNNSNLNYSSGRGGHNTHRSPQPSYHSHGQSNSSGFGRGSHRSDNYTSHSGSRGYSKPYDDQSTGRPTQERKEYNHEYKKEQKKEETGHGYDEEDFEITRKDSKEFTEEKLFKNFDEFKLSENLLRGIYGYGFEIPSRIQSLALPPILAGKDVIAQSQAGTGKTGAFTIGVLNKIDVEKQYPQAIIMSNTHELADQINTVICKLASFMGDKFSTALSIGGIPVKENVEKVKKSQIIVGTPGRIVDLLDNKDFDPTKIKILVLDEADELLKKDFLDKTKFIIQKMPDGDTQICIFSATLPDFAIDLTKNFMSNPEVLLIKKERLTLDMVKQYYIDLKHESYKYDTIVDLYNNISINQCIIFVNSVEKAEWLLEQLKKDKHESQIIHSKLRNTERVEVMQNFRNGKFRVLIATDLMCRGIDVQQVSYVINYDLPKNFRSYIHRIGRSGRYGKAGVAINFLTKNDYRYIEQLERFYKIRIEDMPDPSTLNNMFT